MSRYQMRAPRRLSRRSALGLIGGATVAAGGAAALAGHTQASAAASVGDQVPSAPPLAALRPGGPLDSYLAQQAAQDLFSGTVLISHRGTPVLARSYGMADKQKKIPNGPDTIFGLASVTKLFTATAVVQLVEQGKLDLGGTLGTYLPDWPSNLAGITIHQLLTHTSGMGDYHMSPDYKNESPGWDTPEAVMDGIMGIIKDAKLLFTPGTSAQYSNSGYATLGGIVGQMTGQSYAAYYDYVRTNIFARADMTSSDFYTLPVRQSDPRIAHPYDASQPGGTRTDATGTEYIGSPAANALATAPDMVRYACALFGGQLFSRPWAELMTSAKGPGSTGAGGGGGVTQGSASSSTSPGAAAPSGLQSQVGCYGGLAVIFNDRRIVNMNGGGPGTGESAGIDMHPDLDWDYVYLSNYDNDGGIGNTLTSMERQAITQQAH